MNKQEAIEALNAGAAMHYHRAAMGISASASINGKRVRIDTARSLITDLGLKSDKPTGMSKTYRKPDAQQA